MAQGPRIPLLPEDAARDTGERIGVPQVLAPLSPFRMLLRHPELAKAVSDLLTTLLRAEAKLDAALRELVILRIGWVTGSVYEWTTHWRVARLLGMSEEACLGVRDWRTHAAYGPAERAVLAATDETLETGTISPETWAACEAHLDGTEARLELVVAIGNWRMFSSLLRSLDVPLEDGVAPWPPDGKRPSGDPA